MKYAHKKSRVAIIGTGNIGSDLLVKVLRSRFLECVLFIGQNSASPGIARAASLGVPTAHDSIDAFIRHHAHIDIVFDATNAASHGNHAQVFKKYGTFAIDLTPSKIGYMCVPAVNLKEGIERSNVSMISCGGQATIPLISAITRVVSSIPYVEVVSSIASRSAGIGTRENIDEYTITTSDAITRLAGVKSAKTIIILNPADPAIMMHNTVYIPAANPDMAAITRAVSTATDRIREYVPGFSVVVPPSYDRGRITVMTEVSGSGDFLPVFAGNLDIINSAAIRVAEAHANDKKQATRNKQETSELERK